MKESSGASRLVPPSYRKAAGQIMPPRLGLCYVCITDSIWLTPMATACRPFRAFRTRSTMNSAGLLSGHTRQLANCSWNAGFSSENRLRGCDISKLLVPHNTQTSLRGYPRSMNGIHRPTAFLSDGTECFTPLRLTGWNCHAVSIVASCCAAAE